MNKNAHFIGYVYSSLAALVWGCIQVLYFNHINYVPPLETVSHRGLWGFIILLLFVLLNKQTNIFFSIFKDRKKLFLLCITGLLVSSNWFFFIMAVSLNRVQDSSMGYFISPLLSVAFGYLFFKEKLSIIQKSCLALIAIAIFNIIINLGNIPWIAISVATTWSIYGLLRKKIDVTSHIGLLFETFFLMPFFAAYLLYIHSHGGGNFSIDDTNTSLLLIGAGIITVLPLFLFNLGVKILPLGIAGLVFYIVPTLQFITSVLFLGEIILVEKLISFIIIWFAVIIFIYDSSKNKRYVS